MKAINTRKLLLISLIVLSYTFTIDAQNEFYFNGAADVVLRYPPRGSGGRAFVHADGNILSLNFGGDFTGGTRIGNDVFFKDNGNSYIYSGNLGIGTGTPIDKLDIRGNVYVNSGIDDNHIYWGSHNMTLGTKPGDYSHNVLTLKPGGANEGKLVSAFCMYTANSTTSFEQKVLIHTAGNSFFNGGNVGIGTQSPAYKLDVLGTIRAKEVLVNLDGGADFVFEKGYKLLPIEHVANYVQENKHLPDIPSANEMVKNGVSMGDLQVKLLQKVEELTLYAIQQNKKIETIQKENEQYKAERNNLLAEQQKELSELKKEIETLKKK